MERGPIRAVALIVLAGSIVIAWLGLLGANLSDSLLGSSVRGSVADWLVVREAVLGDDAYAPVSELVEEQIGPTEVAPDGPHPRPPSAIVILSPIGLVALGWITVINAIAMALALVAATDIHLRRYGFSRYSVFLVAPILAISTSLTYGILWGTHIPLVLLAMGLALPTADEDPEPRKRGIFFGIAVALKLFPAALVAVWHRRGPTFLGYAGVTLLVLTVSGLALPGVRFAGAVEALTAAESTFGEARFNLSIAAHLDLLPPLAWILLGLAGAFAAGRLLPYPEATGVATIVMVTTSPLAWPEYQVLLLPAVLAAWRLGWVGKLSGFVWTVAFLTSQTGEVHLGANLLLLLGLLLSSRIGGRLRTGGSVRGPAPLRK